ncbi:hypothetical protein [Parasitella parasitica]|uniref:Uncharacterized protein n=1 Tax=Parasitella parasitica TaxID=35722 RepID=A0A0B7NH46_9FUNG|nr:hypothetical protein [Parasitella parasitica]
MFLALCERIFAKAPIRPAGLKAAPATTGSSSLPVDGRLAHFTQSWHLLTDEEWVRNTIQHGFCIPFHTVPPLRPPPPRHHVKVSHRDSKSWASTATTRRP